MEQILPAVLETQFHEGFSAHVVKIERLMRVRDDSQRSIREELRVQLLELS